MHSNEGENPCRHIIEYDSGALGKSLQLPHRRGLDDIEGSEKYKTREKSFPCHRDGDQCDQLPGNLVDNDKLGIFGGCCSRDASGGRNADERDDHGQRDGNRGTKRGWEFVGDCGPDQDCGH